jgi:CRP-like cAMP-binding protein
MPSVDIEYSFGLTTLKTQSIQFKADGQTREILIPAGKVISQQLIDLVRKVEPGFQIVVQPVLGLQEIIETTRVHLEKDKTDGATAMIKIPYDKDTILFEQGDRSDEIYLLDAGSVAVWVDGILVSKIDERGTYIGELSVLTGLPRSATIKTLEPCRFSVIPGARLEAAVHQAPTFGYKLAVMLAQRLKKTTGQAAAASTRAKATEKLVEALSDDFNIFLSHSSNAFIADLKHRMKHIDLLDGAGLLDPASLLAKVAKGEQRGKP